MSDHVRYVRWVLPDDMWEAIAFELGEDRACRIPELWVQVQREGGA